MKMKQKAQSIVEFALILPILIILFMGILYAGFMLSDYVAMNSVARSIAREAAVKGPDNKTAAKHSWTYGSFEEKCRKSELPNSYYKWDNSGISVEREADSEDIVVKLKANVDKSALPFGVYKLVPLEHLNVTYRMFDEYGENNGN